MALIRDWSPEINFDYAPVLWRFWNSTARVRWALGPVGSGKTVACCINPFSLAMKQEPNHNGLRPFKLAVVRNAMPELWRTTIETWLGIFPEEYCGAMRRSAPVGHKIYIPDLGDGTQLGFEAEFFGLDRPKDVKALLSYEPTMIYFNEAREIPKPLIDAAGDRVGRYPSMKKGGVMPSFSGIIGDSNPPDREHWMYRAYEKCPEGWEFYLQPPGLSEVKKISPTHYREIEGEPPVGDYVTDDFVVRGPGEKIYAVNPNAENLPNLPYDTSFDPEMRGVTPLQMRLNDPPLYLRRGNYYLARVPAKKQDWINGYYRNKFVFVQEGSPVIPEFSETTMTVEHMEVIPDIPLEGGYDMGSGTLNPAGVIGQRYRGMYLVHAELSIDDCGLYEFAEQMVRLLHEPAFADCKLGTFTGDPAGGTKDGLFGEIYYDHLRKYGLPVKPAETNATEIRKEALRTPMVRSIRGRPAVLINRTKCPRLVRGLAGAWCYRRLETGGDDKFATTPEKNVYSHVCEALGYWFLGAGEVKNLTHRRADRLMVVSRPVNDEYDYFGDG